MAERLLRIGPNPACAPPAADERAPVQGLSPAHAAWPLPQGQDVRWWMWLRPVAQRLLAPQKNRKKQRRAFCFFLFLLVKPKRAIICRGSRRKRSTSCGRVRGGKRGLCVRSLWPCARGIHACSRGNGCEAEMFFSSSYLYCYFVKRVNAKVG